MAEEEHQRDIPSSSENEEEDDEEDDEMDTESEDNEKSKKNNEQRAEGSKSSSGKSKKKNRRKRKSRGQRRNIKSKYDTVEDLNPEALSAHTEEVERLRRLELQQSLTNKAASSLTVEERSVQPNEPPKR